MTKEKQLDIQDYLRHLESKPIFKQYGVSLDVEPLINIKNFLISLDFEFANSEGVDNKSFDIDFKYKCNHKKLGTFILGGSLMYGKYYFRQL